MRKRQEEELRRLEEALLKEDAPDMLPEDPEDWDPDWEVSEDSEYYDAYNTDDVDVDLDEYSEDVHDGAGRGGAGILIVMLTMIVLSAGFLLLLK